MRITNRKNATRLLVLCVFATLICCQGKFYQIPNKIHQLKIKEIQGLVSENNLSISPFDYISSKDGQNCLELKNQNLKTLKVPKNFKGTLLIIDHWPGPNDYNPDILCSSSISFNDSVYDFKMGKMIDSEPVYSMGLDYLMIYDQIVNKSDTLYVESIADSYSDYMIIRDGDVKIYLNIKKNKYFYIDSREKAFAFKEYDLQSLTRSGMARIIHDSLRLKYTP